MRLLFITRRVDRHDPRAGFVIGWIEELCRNVEQLNVICLEKGDIAGLPANCEIYSLGKERGKNRLREFFRFHVLASQLVPTVDGIFTHQNPEYGIMVALWARIFRKKLIAWYVHKSVTWKTRLLHKLVDRIVTASTDSFRIRSSKVSILQHGIDTDMFQLAPVLPTGKAKQLLSVSRISPSKGIDTMIKLVAALVHEGADVRLNVIGAPAIPSDLAHKRSLEALAAELGVASRVAFLGPVAYAETVQHYQAAGLFLNFSRTGSVDKAVLEAMCCGTPILTTNEAFQKIFSSVFPDFYCTEETIEKLSSRTAMLLTRSVKETHGVQLREYVVMHQNLKHLIKKIVALFA